MRFKFGTKNEDFIDEDTGEVVSVEFYILKPLVKNKKGFK